MATSHRILVVKSVSTYICFPNVGAFFQRGSYFRETLLRDDVGRQGCWADKKLRRGEVDYRTIS